MAGKRRVGGVRHAVARNDAGRRVRLDIVFQAGFLGRDIARERVEAFGLSSAEDSSGSRVAIVEALGRIASLDETLSLAVADRLVSAFPSAEHHLVRRAAEQYLPGVATHWGPSSPVTTGRGHGTQTISYPVSSPSSGEWMLEVIVRTEDPSITGTVQVS